MFTNVHSSLIHNSPDWKQPEWPRVTRPNTEQTLKYYGAAERGTLIRGWRRGKEEEKKKREEEREEKRKGEITPSFVKLQNSKGS